jgi:hypothetical protein
MPATLMPAELYLRLSDEFDPAADYVAMGIRTIRVIQPKTGTISTFAGGKLEPVEAVVEQLPGTPCSIDWAKVKEMLDW